MTQKPSLSERELEILALAATGLSNREIAQKLTISPNTVKVHLRNIFEKTGAASRTEAAMVGMEHGLVDLPPGAVKAEPVQEDWRAVAWRFRWVGLGVFFLIVLLVIALGTNLIFPRSGPEQAALTAQPERWQQLASLPEPRAAMAAAAYDGQIYALAGEGPAGVSGSVFRYDPPTDAWEQLSDKPTPVADVHAALIGEKLYVPGGRLGDGGVTDILEIYDPRRDTWEAGAPMPLALSAYGLADFEGQLYLFGGWDGESAQDVVLIYDPGADAWREGTRMSTPRYDHGAAVLGDKIVVLGGRNEAGTLALGESYYPARDGGEETPWEAFVDLPEPRAGFGVAAVSDSLYVMGGESGIPDEDVRNGWVFDGGEWSQLPVEGEIPGISVELTSAGNLLYILNSTGANEQANLWSYRALFYEIFIPIIQ